MESFRALRVLADRIDAAWVSDHLCFCGFDGFSGHDLWPLPFTEEAVAHVAARVSRIQDILGRRLALENIATYVRFSAAEMTEWEFVREVAERADADVLLDLGNVFINAHNHGFDPRVFVSAMPTGRLRQIHLAGHDDLGSHLFDGPVPDGVWGLFRHCVGVHGPIPTVVEWDRDVPPLAGVLAESARAAETEADVLGDRP